MEKKLFIGIKILPSLELIGIYQELKRSLDNEKIKWTPFQNLHITLKFLGNTPEYLISGIKKALEEITELNQTFNFKIKGLGSFTKNNKIKVIWMGIEDGSEINAFVTKLIRRFELIGYEDEKRKFTAHLTLGRVNFISDVNLIKKLISDRNELLIQNVEVKEITLFESIVRFDGPHYEAIDTFSLKE